MAWRPQRIIATQNPSRAQKSMSTPGRGFRRSFASSVVPSVEAATCHVVFLPDGVATKGLQDLLMLADVAEVAGYPVVHRVPKQQHVHWLLT